MRMMIAAWIMLIATPLADDARAQTPPQENLGEEAPAPEDFEPFEGPMTPERLGVLIARVGEDVSAAENGRAWAFRVSDRPVQVVVDPDADRMRILTPIAAVGALTPELMERLLQANFDTALDARYAIAQGALWGVFVHPLSPLDDGEFLSGLGQTVNIALTFGGSYTSGVLAYGGGDSQALQERRLLEELEKKGRGI